MPQTVRKIDAERVEVIFDKPLGIEQGPGKALADFVGEHPDMQMLMTEDGRAEGVQAKSKTYVQFLQSMNVSKETIRLFRSSLDDSRKAVRARQREPRKP